MAPGPAAEGARLSVTLDSAQVRYGKELDRPFVTVSVITADGTPLEARVPRNPFGPPPPPPLSLPFPSTQTNTCIRSSPFRHTCAAQCSCAASVRKSSALSLKRYTASQHQERLIICEGGYII